MRFVTSRVFSSRRTSTQISFCPSKLFRPRYGKSGKISILLSESHLQNKFAVVHSSFKGLNHPNPYYSQAQLCLRLSLATLTVRRTISVRTAGSGPLLGTIRTICTTSTPTLQVRIRIITTIATTATLFDAS